MFWMFALYFAGNFLGELILSAYHILLFWWGRLNPWAIAIALKCSHFANSMQQQHALDALKRLVNVHAAFVIAKWRHTCLESASHPLPGILQAMPQVEIKLRFICSNSRMRLAGVVFFFLWTRPEHQILLSRRSAAIRCDALRSAAVRCDPLRWTTCCL